MNIHGLRGFVAVLVFLLTAAPVCAAKKEPLGRVTSLAGGVQVQSEDDAVWRQAALKMIVYFGDSVRTLEDGESIITLSDDSIIKIHPNSHVALNSIVSPVEEKNSILLFFGRIWNKIAKKALKKKRFEVQTPTAVCGVRGTAFETAAYEDGSVVVLVEEGAVSVDNDVSAQTLAANQGTEVTIETRQIETTTGLAPNWRQKEQESRQKLFSDGEKYGGRVKGEIDRRNDYIKQLVQEAAALKKRRDELKTAAAEAQAGGDTIVYEDLAARIAAANEALKDLNRRIAYEGRRLECQFGLFTRYGELARHPIYAEQFNGKDFILAELDNVEMIRAEFDAMMEEGLKLSMEDMEDLMDEMRDKMKDFRNSRTKSDPFTELD